MLAEGTFLREGLFLQVCMFLAVLIVTMILIKTKPEYAIGQRLLRNTFTCFFILLPYYALYMGEIGSIQDVIGVYLYGFGYGLFWGIVAELLIGLYFKITKQKE